MCQKSEAILELNRIENQIHECFDNKPSKYPESCRIVHELLVKEVNEIRIKLLNYNNART